MAGVVLLSLKFLPVRLLDSPCYGDGEKVAVALGQCHFVFQTCSGNPML